MESHVLAQKISEFALEKKGEDVVIMDMAELTTSCDYFVVITGSSDIHSKSIADHIERQLREDGIRLNHKEGYVTANWILLDYIDVVVHIFKPDIRDYYDLESLWADAKVKLVRDEVK
ncbi:MAG: ribosome silencing factor [Calditrichia bacterium]